MVHSIHHDNAFPFVHDILENKSDVNILDRVTPDAAEKHRIKNELA
jgi:hypothetical protein